MPDPVQLAAWIAVAFFIAAGVNQVLRLADRMKEQPAPSATYVTKDFCHTEHGHTLGRLGQAENDIRDVRREVQMLMTSLNEMNAERANQLTQLLAQLRGEFNDSMRRVHARIDDIPNQVIVTLKNTGALD